MMCIIESVKKSRMIFASLLNKIYFKQLLLTDITYQEAYFYITEKNGKEKEQKKESKHRVGFHRKKICFIYFD